MTISGYDTWKLSSPNDDRIVAGTEDGQPCMRHSDPDEDAPRGYKPKLCEGVMVYHEDGVSCDACGVWV